MWNLPNSLTLARILMAPLLVVVLLTEIPDKAFWGLGIFLLAASTDLMDGIIARRTNRITVTGALLDPIADKLLMSAAFISLVELGLAPAWMVFCIVGREFAVTALRVVAMQRGLSISANIWGKVKTGTQVAAVALLIFGHGDPEQWRILATVHQWRVLGALALWLALAFTLASMVVYFWQNWDVVRGDHA